ncbi:(d)CMP kinase [bacterium]|nr:(d)CMP kinase [bacterium]
MMRPRRVITVDGLAGTGKTTLSKLLAERLGFVHMSTGLLYRAVGYLALRANVSRDDQSKLAELIRTHDIKLVLGRKSSGDDRSARIVIDGDDVFDSLYSPQVSEATSEVAVHPAVRDALVAAQREAFPGEDLVAEGRDMGTVIFPEADVKFWIETEEKIKVARRLQQILEKEQLISEERKVQLAHEMRIEIHERDKRDQERGLAPSIQGADMVRIANSGSTIEEVLQEMIAHVTSALKISA